MITQWLLLPYLIPLFIALVLFFGRFNERRIVYLSFASFVLPFINTVALVISYLVNGGKPVNFPITTIHLLSYHFPITFFVDSLSVIILILTGYFSLIVGKFSHSYLHREKGFRLYFATINMFIFGMHAMALAGTFDLFFAGWEVVGLSSFLLISFYRHRTRPVKNAFRVFSIYRLCDVGLLMSAILSHYLLHDHATFDYLIAHASAPLKEANSIWLNLIGLLILLAAMGKSGQFPFMNWPARAMEGPTPSSAIFYGALSIHAGVFLLLRSRPIWLHAELMTGALITIGALTFIYSSLIGRVQSNIKGQIAYASTAQIGIMLIELGLNFTTLATVHLFCHALYRCYQILISPSIVVDHIKKLEISTESPPAPVARWRRRLESTLYLYALQEGALEISERGSLGLPFIRYKLLLRNCTSSNLFPLLLTVLALVIAWWQLHLAWHELCAYCCAGAALGLSTQCLMSHDRPKVIWNKFGLALLLILLAPLLFTPQDYLGAVLYSFSAIPMWFLGRWSLRGTALAEMHHFNGLQRLNPKKTRIFLLAFITFSGMPFTTTFLGEDILLYELVQNGAWLLAIILAAFTINGLVCARLLCKVFFGHPSYQRL